MEKEELKKKIIEVMEKTRLTSLATLDGDMPKVRYMMLQHSGDGFDLYGATFTQSRKVAQIKSNNNMQVIMGGDASNLGAPYITVTGTAEIVVDPVVKDQCWSEELAQHFKGPDDPNYSVLKISPKVVEYMAAGAHEPEVCEV